MPGMTSEDQSNVTAEGILNPRFGGLGFGGLGFARKLIVTCSLAERKSSIILNPQNWTRELSILTFVRQVHEVPMAVINLIRH
jgi:hypothetical protein